MKSLDELKKEAKKQNYHGSLQFPLQFQDGSIIFQDPDLMDKPLGFPRLNTQKYLEEHHPERVPEYQEHVKEFKKRCSKW